MIDDRHLVGRAAQFALVAHNGQARKYTHEPYIAHCAEVAGLVGEVTDVSKPSDGKRVVRKAIDRAHLAGASPDGKTIKLADLISNTRNIVAHDPGFARVYLAEKRLRLHAEFMRRLEAEGMMRDEASRVAYDMVRNGGQWKEPGKRK